LERGNQPEVVERLRAQLDRKAAHVLQRRDHELAQLLCRRLRLRRRSRLLDRFQPEQDRRQSLSRFIVQLARQSLPLLLLPRAAFDSRGRRIPIVRSETSPAAASTRSASPCGSAITTSRASISSRSRVATRSSSFRRSSSPTSALPISFSDSSCRDHAVDDSYRRAFSTATAACAASSVTSSSSSPVNASPPSFSVR